MTQLNIHSSRLVFGFLVQMSLLDLQSAAMVAGPCIHGAGEENRENSSWEMLEIVFQNVQRFFGIH